MYTYCLFCETGKCDYVARAAMQAYPCEAISPKQIQHTWDKGHFINREHDLLPGYVFLYSEEPILQPQDVRKNLDRVLRFLRTADLDYELHGSDEAFAMMLYRKHGVIGKTEVTETDGRFTITDETFKTIQASILKVDRRNGRMKIEMLVAGSKVQTWVEYEIQDSKNQEEHDNI